MPMSESLQERLFPRLPEIIEHFGTPFHIMDAQGILDTGKALKTYFGGFPGFREYYAVKANPDPAVLNLMKEMGFGRACSSPSELVLARRGGI